MATNNNSSVTKGGKTKWTSISISKLISTYKRVKTREEKGVRFWEYVQSEMDKAGFFYSISECKIKWGQLLKMYYVNKETKANWLHFKEMDEIYQNQDTNESKVNKNKITFYFKTKKITPPSPQSQ